MASYDPVKDEISPDEMELASKLRGLCTPSGQEREDTLLESAEVLIDLGQEYVHKAADAVGMRKKITFIRASALLCGAKARFERLGDADKIEDVQGKLARLSEKIIFECSTETKKHNLFATSNFIREKLTVLRNENNAILDSLEVLDEQCDESQRRLKEENKIRRIQELMADITDKYKNLMQEISVKCQDILGPAPCKFAQVGLGSLARKEITYYSDFEHVIILEEGVQGRKNYTEIIEYFRWFAVLFQVIVIGLGETFIRSVGVTGLNDLYANDRKKNWFYDVITPCGIAFDGMVPHSCMNPLGRQEATDMRTHVVEFIQPAGVMANYLTSAEHIKNGYYVKDILSRSCLVSGDIDVYRYFEEQSKKILNSEDMKVEANDLLTKIDTNVNEHIRSNVEAADLEAFNAKSKYYRPVTALLSFLSRLHGIYVPSTFDIVSELFRSGAVNETWAHNFRYAVAVVCELRLRAYAATGHQRHEMEMKTMARNDLVHCSDIIRCLSVLTKFGIKLWLTFGNLDVFKIMWKRYFAEMTDPGLGADVHRLLSTGRYIEAAALAERYKETMHPDDEYNMCRIRNLLATCYFLLGQDEPENTENFWEKAEAESKAVLEMAVHDKRLEQDRHGCIRLLIKIYTKQKRHEEVLEMCRLWFELYSNLDETRKSVEPGLAAVHYLDIEARLHTMGPEDTKAYLQSLLSNENDSDVQYVAKQAIARVHVLTGETEKAKKELAGLVLDISAKAHQIKSPMLWLQRIFEMQDRQGWYEDVLKTLDVMLELPGHERKIVEATLSRPRLECAKLEFLFKTGKNEEALKFYQMLSEESRKESLRLLRADVQRFISTGKYKEAAALAERYKQMMHPDDEYIMCRVRNLLAACYFFIDQDEPENTENFGEKAEAETKAVIEMTARDEQLEQEKHGCIRLLIKMYTRQKRHEEVLEICRLWFDLYNNMDEKKKSVENGPAAIHYLDIEARFHTMGPEDTRAYLQSLLSNENDPDVRYVAKQAIARVHILTGETEKAKKELAELVLDISAKAYQIKEYLLQMIFETQNRQGWYEDVLKTLDVMLELPGRKRRIVEATLSRPRLECAKLEFLFKTGKNEEALKFYQVLSEEGRKESLQGLPAEYRDKVSEATPTTS